MKALIEPGIGATRALVIEGDTVLEAHFQRDDAGPRAGAVWTGRLTSILPGARRGIVRLDGTEALLDPVPPAFTEGALVRVEVVREAVAEAGRARLAKLRAADGPVGAEREIAPGPSLAERLAARGLFVTEIGGPGEDRLEAAGWGETVDAAQTGYAAFDGGLLTISPTPAMTVIDVDGPGDAEALAQAAAIAVAQAIRRFDLTGSIGIDFPTLGGKAARTAIGDLLDAHLPAPFERTAMNGFGFVQIVRPRLRPSFVEAVRAPVFAALELLRRAGRGEPGRRTLIAHPQVIDWLKTRPDLLAALERQTGGAAALQANPALAISAGHAV